MKTLGYWLDRLKISLHNDTCVLCHQVSPVQREQTLCTGCERRLYLRQFIPAMNLDVGPIYAACEFPYPMKQLIYGLKFSDKHANGLTLAEVLIHYWQQLPLAENKRWVVVPIPPHADSSHVHLPLIARPFASHFGFDFVENALVWTRPVQTQHSIANRRLRGQNMAKALRLNPAMNPDTSFLIVDDLLTSGATLAEAMHAIRRDQPACKIAALAVSHVPLSLNRYE